MDGTVTVQCPAVGQGMIKDMQLAHNYEVRAKGHGFAILLDGAEAKGVEDLAPDVSCVVRAPDVSCVVRASMFRLEVHNGGKCRDVHATRVRHARGQLTLYGLSLRLRVYVTVPARWREMMCENL